MYIYICMYIYIYLSRAKEEKVVQRLLPEGGQVWGGDGGTESEGGEQEEGAGQGGGGGGDDESATGGETGAGEEDGATGSKDSEPLPAPALVGMQPGFLGQFYFTGHRMEDMPNTATTIPDVTYIAPKIDLTTKEDFESIDPDMTPDYLAAVWTGLIAVETPGPYDFFVTSAEGSRLFIDGSQAVDNGGLHGSNEAKGTVSLGRGYHMLRAEFFKNDGEGEMVVEWSGPDTMHQKEMLDGMLCLRACARVLIDVQILNICVSGPDDHRPKTKHCRQGIPLDARVSAREMSVHMCLTCLRMQVSTLSLPSAQRKTLLARGVLGARGRVATEAVGEVRGAVAVVMGA